MENQILEQKKQNIILEDIDELVRTDNSLSDLIKWANMGYIIVLNSGKYARCFVKPEFKSSDKLIQINLKLQWKSLINDGEWPWYLCNNGNCVEMNSEDFNKIKLKEIRQFDL